MNMNKEIFIKSLKLLVAIVLGSVLTFYLFSFGSFILDMVNIKPVFFVILPLVSIFLFFLMSLGYIFQKISKFDDRYPIPFISSISYLYFLGAMNGKSLLAPLSFIASMFDYDHDGLVRIGLGFLWVIVPFCIIIVAALFSKGFEFALKNKESNS